METTGTNILNFKGYRFITVKGTPSYLANNLVSTGGDQFIYVNNSDSGAPKAIIYDKELIEKGETLAPSILQWKDAAECMGLSSVRIDDKWYLVVCTVKNCQVWNYNGTRQMTFIENKKVFQNSVKTAFFTCASSAITTDGEQFMAVGTNYGEIYYVSVNGSNFNKDVGFTMSDESSIMAMACDYKSKTLAVGNSTGYIILFTCESTSQWKPLEYIGTQYEIPVISISCLNRGENLFCAGFANGLIKIVSTQGQLLAEIGAHTRCISAIACHPSKSVFVTVGDDTFMNLYEVSGEKKDKLDVDLILSSRVNDYVLVGVAFGGDNFSSILATTYDFPTMVLWNGVV